MSVLSMLPAMGQFECEVKQVGNHLMIEITCRCGATKLVSVIDASRGVWQREHICAESIHEGEADSYDPPPVVTVH
jgi:hypothetical protein